MTDYVKRESVMQILYPGIKTYVWIRRAANAIAALPSAPVSEEREACALECDEWTENSDVPPRTRITLMVAARLLRAPQQQAEPRAWLVVDTAETVGDDIVIAFRERHFSNAHINDALCSDDAELVEAAKHWRLEAAYAAPPATPDSEAIALLRRVEALWQKELSDTGSIVNMFGPGDNLEPIWKDVIAYLEKHK